MGPGVERELSCCVLCVPGAVELARQDGVHWGKVLVLIGGILSTSNITCFPGLPHTANMQSNGHSLHIRLLVEA